MRAPFPFAVAAVVVALLAVYFGVQGGGAGAAAPRGIEFRCQAVEYGLIPYEVTHPGRALTDPYCQPQPEEAADDHEHARTDPGLTADAPTWLTPLTATFMHGSALQLLASVVFLLAFGPRLERRIGPLGFLAVFLAAGLVSAAALIALAPNLPIATLGAAGAVSGVIGAHLALVPRAALTPFELPALGLLGAWIVVQAALAYADAAQPVAGAGGDIAYLAPAAGLLAGLALSVRAPAAARSARTARGRTS